MTTLGEIRDRKVVSLATALTVGQINDVVVDPAHARILALRLKKTEDADILPWSNVTAFGEDAVTVADGDKIVNADDTITEFSDKAHALHGKRVLTTLGEEVGEVADLELDVSDGTIINVLLKNGDPIEGKRLVAAGSYAVVVSV